MFPPGHNDADASVRGTDGDASLARLSAAKRGYLADPFVNHFVTRPHLQPPRPPLINVGTYLRTSGLDQLVNQWIELSPQNGLKCQIVSLGAGSDTRYWRLSSDGKIDTNAKYIEIDFPEITTKKAMAIRKHKELSTHLGDPANVRLDDGGTSLHSPIYHLLAADLRRDPGDTLGRLFTGILDPSLPTLLLFECVLCYMQPATSERLILWFKDHFDPSTTVGCVIYEMFGLNDPFGRVMKSNLMARNVELPGAEPYQTLADIRQRLNSLGFPINEAYSMDMIRKECTPKQELQRISRLEMLDEIEELSLVLGHYAISWGVFAPDTEGQEWSEWRIKTAAEVEGLN